MTLALVLTLGYAVVEALAGWWSGSLALLSEDRHLGRSARFRNGKWPPEYLRYLDGEARHEFLRGLAAFSVEAIGEDRAMIKGLLADHAPA